MLRGGIDIRRHCGNHDLFMSEWRHAVGFELHHYYYHYHCCHGHNRLLVPERRIAVGLDLLHVKLFELRRDALDVLQLSAAQRRQSCGNHVRIHDVVRGNCRSTLLLPERLYPLRYDVCRIFWWHWIEYRRHADLLLPQRWKPIRLDVLGPEQLRCHRHDHILLPEWRLSLRVELHRYQFLLLCRDVKHRILVPERRHALRNDLHDVLDVHRCGRRDDHLHLPQWRHTVGQYLHHHVEHVHRHRDDHLHLPQWRHTVGDQL